MGWWSVGILGGDIPSDVEREFDAIYNKHDPTPSDAVVSINHICKRSGFDRPFISQTIGCLMMMMRGAEFNDDLRTEVLRGIRQDPTSTFNDELGRRQTLRKFTQLVNEYPNFGCKKGTPEFADMIRQLRKVI